MSENIDSLSVDWVNVNNVKSENDIRATSDLFGKHSDYIKTGNFDFGVPAGSRITGIQVEVNRVVSTAMSDYQVRIVKSNGVVGNQEKKKLDNWEVLIDESIFYPAININNDLWGEIWSVDDINSINFGFAFSAIHPEILVAQSTAQVDYIRMKVHYSVLE